MPANLSLILNFILLVMVIVAISRLMKTRRSNLPLNHQQQPSLGSVDRQSVDEIIAVRKVATVDEEDDVLLHEASALQSQTVDESQVYVRPSTEPGSSYFVETDMTQQLEVKNSAEANKSSPGDNMIMMFLLAKDNRQFAGYELLQTVLAAGLRFGEGDLFHRHQLPNGQGPVIFSLAAATNSGVFDLQNIGAFNARGLCLFMQVSGNSTIDMDRFNILYETARQLSEGLDAHLLDEKRRPLTKDGLARYQKLFG